MAKVRKAGITAIIVTVLSVSLKVKCMRILQPPKLPYKINMNINQMIKKADDAYINYMNKCESLAKEAQKYIDWDDKVSCEYLPADGLCILATVPSDCNTSGMPESVCPVDSFFSSVKAKEKITPYEFKEISI
jgi:hypothetical protein